MNRDLVLKTREWLVSEMQRQELIHKMLTEVKQVYGNDSRFANVTNALLKHTSPEMVWDQDVWYDRNSCGTVCCIAGFAVAHSGKYTVETRRYGGTVRYGPTRNDGICVRWHVAGAEVLDIEQAIARDLFDTDISGARALDILDYLLEDDTDAVVSWDGYQLVGP